MRQTQISHHDGLLGVLCSSLQEREDSCVHWTVRMINYLSWAGREQIQKNAAIRCEMSSGEGSANMYIKAKQPVPGSKDRKKQKTAKS